MTVSPLSLRLPLALVAALGLLATAACGSSGGSVPKASDTTTSVAKTPSTSASSSGFPASATPTVASSSGTPIVGTPTLDQLKAELIDPSVIPGDTFTLLRATQFNSGPGVGVEGLFQNGADSRALSDIVIYFPTAAQANAAFGAEAKPSLGGKSLKPGFTNLSVAVGDQGHLFAGTDTGGGPATLVVFQEGNYVVTMDLHSVDENDSIPNDVATAVAEAQDVKVKAAS